MLSCICKKKLPIFFAFVLVVVIFMSSSSSSEIISYEDYVINSNSFNGNENLDQSQWNCNNYIALINNSISRIKQDFCFESKVMSKIKIYIYRKGIPGDITLSIFTNSTKIESHSIPAIEVHTNAEWIEFDFSDIIKNMDEKYEMYIEANCTDDDNYYMIGTFYDNLNDPYDKGSLNVYNCVNKQYITQIDTDLAFLVYGYPALSIRVTKPTNGLYISNIKRVSIFKTVVLGNLDIDIEIANYASDIIWVDYYLNEKLIESKTCHPYYWECNERVFGLQNIKIHAYDNAGNQDIKNINIWKFF